LGGENAVTEKTYQVLFLSRRNSARSIMAEAILNDVGRGGFRAYSAGVAPGPFVEPAVIELMRSSGLPVGMERPRHFAEFAAKGARYLDFVFTLSDTAAGEPLPEWPGLPITAHWSSADPVLVTGVEWERKRAFARAFSELKRRIGVFVSLPFASLDRMSLKARVDDIGRPVALVD
jgi:arsenate reductase